MQYGGFQQRDKTVTVNRSYCVLKSVLLKKKILDIYTSDRHDTGLKHHSVCQRFNISLKIDYKCCPLEIIYTCTRRSDLSN